MNCKHLIVQVYSERERRKKLNKLKMDTVSFVAAGTFSRQELCSLLAVGGSISACRVPALMDINGNKQLSTATCIQVEARVSAYQEQPKYHHCI
jgi:hypothetical protein